ncbi:hypothetical protein [Kitasatospora sp. NPDC088346]|uniref:WXG100-like domain-containing protein n=1 Tax=Kitasatospora sp. NPDC088346 TaxID=3364073 RepID=UPI0037FA64F6
MATELPEPLQWVLLLLSGTRWPEADEDSLRGMAEHWRTMAETLNEVEESADAAVKRALTGQVGVAATGLSQYWDQFTVGKGEAQPGVFPGLAKACEGMGEMLESMANSAETAKIQIIAQLGILAVEIATAEVEAPFTAGLSLAQIPVMVGVSRTVVQQILKKLATEAMKFAAKQAVQMAAINLLAQSIQVLEGHRKGLDMKELGQNAVGGAVAGASGNLLGKGIGAAGSKLGVGKALGTVPGRMATGAAVGVGADVVTQAVTTGTVDSHSLLGSGLSGASAAGLHAAGAAVNEHFKAPVTEVPHGGVPGAGGPEPAAGAHGPEQSPSAASGNPAGTEGGTGTGGSRGMPAASEHAAGAEAHPAAEHGAPAGGTHDGVPAGGQHPAAGSEASPAGAGGTHGPATEPAGGAAQHAADGSGAAQSQGQSHPAAPPSEHGGAGGGSPVSAAHGSEGGSPMHGPSAPAEGGAPSAHGEASPAHGGGTHTPMTEGTAPAAAGSHAPGSEATPAQHVGPASAHEAAPAAVPHESSVAPVLSHSSSLPLHEAAPAGAQAAHETPVPAGGGRLGADLPQVHLPQTEAASVHPVAEVGPRVQHVADLPQVHVPVETGPVRPVVEVGPRVQHVADLPQVHVPQTEVAALAAPEAPVRPVGSGADEIRLASPAEGPSSGAGRPVSAMPEIHPTPVLNSSATAPAPGTAASSSARPTVQPGHPGVHVPADFRTGPVRPEAPHAVRSRVESSPARVEGGPGRPGTGRQARPLHEHPAGPSLVFPYQKSALQKVLYKAEKLLVPGTPNNLSALLPGLPHSSPGGKHLHPVTGKGDPLEGTHLNKRTKTFKTNLDPITFSDLASPVRKNLLKTTEEAIKTLPSYKFELSGHERIELVARQDYRTADYWNGQDARRAQLDEMVAANGERQPAGLPHEALANVDRVLGDAHDAISGARAVLGEHDGFVLGEGHSASRTWPFLKDNMAALHEAGVSTVYLEALRGDSFQPLMEEFLRSPQDKPMPPELKLMIERYDRSWNSLEGNDLHAMVQEAKVQGVRVQFVDGLPTTGNPPGPWGVFQRAGRFNTYAADAIAGDVERAGKYVLVVGKAHVHPHDVPTAPLPDGMAPTTHAAPGLSQLLDVPGLELGPRRTAGESGGQGADVIVAESGPEVLSRIVP